MAKSVQAVLDKWAANTSAGASRIPAAIDAMTENPMAKAAQHVDKAVINYTNAAPRMKRKLEQGNFEDWKTAFKTKGVPRIAAGVQNAKPKFGRFLESFLPVMDSASKAAKALPNNNLDEAMARVRLVAERAMQFAGKS